MIELLLIALIIWAFAMDFKEYAEQGKLGSHYNTVNNHYGKDTIVNNDYDGEYEIMEEDFYERRN
jgi:hypothetical protein